MASSIVLSSRRKQAKPQRLPEEEPNSEAMSADVSPSSEEAIDLSTKRVAAILEDKSNLLSFSHLSNSQQLLNFCAQLAAANRGKSPSSTPPATPRRDYLSCAATGCSERFPSKGALLWHVMEQHQHSKLLRCDNCSERFNDREQIQEHDCSSQMRPSTADCTSSPPSSPDADRGSVPATAGPSFSLVEPEFPEDQLDETDTPEDSLPIPPPLLLPPTLPQPFPPFAARPSPFFLRPPFDPRQDVFVPRPTDMNNEDDWEALMEISTTDEGEKIRQLVGDKAIPTTDPNQCILCRRVLSCKSALQMHYRTHTGERPFKCKICQRAFTTKGNLKTHMGVHRAKHSFRGVIGPPLGPMAMPPGLHAAHQCPICQKRFISTIQLQAHIAEHTHSLTGRIPPPQHVAPPGFPPGFPLFPFFNQAFPPTSIAELPQAAPFNLAQLLGKQLQTEEIRVNPRMEEVPMLVKEEIKPTAQVVNSSISPSGSDGSSDQLHDQTDGSSVGRPESAAEAKTPNHTAPELVPAVVGQVEESPKKSDSNPLEAMRKMWAETEPPPPRQAPVLSKHQCGVCFKHFSSSSALQIHMRTHTGDKPFKCEVCGRAFTTRGNLKVHMGTHMWQQSPSRRGRRIFDASPGEAVVLKSPMGIAPLAPPLGLFPPAAVPSMEMMMMLWRTVCSVCQKVCASPSELEQHLKEHLSSTSEAAAC